MKLSLKVVPGSSREGIAGWLGDELKVRVRQVAESGKANRAVRELLAKTLDVGLDDVQITAGTASPHKTIEIRGLDATEVRRRLGI